MGHCGNSVDGKVPQRNQKSFKKTLKKITQVPVCKIKSLNQSLLKATLIFQLTSVGFSWILFVIIKNEKQESHDSSLITPNIHLMKSLLK